MSQINGNISSANHLQNLNPQENNPQTKLKNPVPSSKSQNLPVQDNSKSFNFKALGIDVRKFDQNTLRFLKYSPATVRHLASYQLSKLKLAHRHEKKLKMHRLEGKVALGRLKKEDLDNEIAMLESDQAQELQSLESDLGEIIAAVEQNREKFEGRQIKKLGLENSQTEELFKKWDNFDKTVSERFIKDLPPLDPQANSSSFLGRLCSGSGLTMLGTTLVGGLAVSLGIAALPACGILAALVSSNVAVPALYSSISSFMAICNPKAKATLENIDDIRRAMKGKSAELLALKRNLDSDRHSKEINSIKDLKTNPTQVSSKDLLAEWQAEHPLEPLLSLKDIKDPTKYEPKFIDVNLLGLSGLNAEEHLLLSHSPDAVQKLANYEIAKQQNWHQRELNILERKLKALVAIGELSPRDKEARLQECQEKQALEHDTLCSDLANTLALAKINRSILQGRDLAFAHKTKNQNVFSNLIANREKNDQAIIKRYCDSLPPLGEEPKKSTFWGRLFSWSGVKMLATGALATAGLIAGAIGVASLGPAVALGLTIPAVTPNLLSTVNSFVAICNPRAKDVLQYIDDFRKGVNGRPTELSKMKRDLDAERHQEILDQLKESPKKESKTNLNTLTAPKTASLDQNFVNQISDLVARAKDNKDPVALAQLEMLQKALNTVMKAESHFDKHDEAQNFILHQRHKEMLI